MTTSDELLSVEEKVVVCFDICSSSSMLEDLLATNNLKTFRNVLIAMKQLLKAQSKDNGFEVYKFIGDGWIILFPPETTGTKLIRVLTELSKLFYRQMRKRLAPRLQCVPAVTGLTFGVDKGPLVRIRMLEQTEYIGRALNVASRLQSAIKDKDKRPSYKALFSKHASVDLGISAGTKGAKSVTRKLRNIHDGKRVELIKVALSINSGS